MLKIGDLVSVQVRQTTDEWMHGAVVDYRPDVYGGSSIVSYKVKGGWKQETQKTPVRGEVLVRSYTDGSLSWYDEIHVRLFEGVVE